MYYTQVGNRYCECTFACACHKIAGGKGSLKVSTFCSHWKGCQL